MVVVLRNNVVINIWYQLRLDRIIFNSYFASKILEILYLVLPIVVYSDLYQHERIVSIGSYLILVLQPLLLHEQEKHVTMIFSVGDLQVFL